jgi:hypothetical protein
VVVREAATIHVHSDGDLWRLYDHEGVAQGVFRNLPACLSAARYLARDRAPSCIKMRDERGVWKVVERFSDEGSDVAVIPEQVRRAR